MSSRAVDSLVSGSFRLGQAWPQTAVYINQKVNQLLGLGSNPGRFQSLGYNAGAGNSSKRNTSPQPGDIEPEAWCEVVLGEVTIPPKTLNMYICDVPEVLMWPKAGLAGLT